MRGRPSSSLSIYRAHSADINDQPPAYQILHSFVTASQPACLAIATAIAATRAGISGNLTRFDTRLDTIRQSLPSHFGSCKLKHPRSDGKAT
ncbi:conserved hypothetical protein [Aspergillus fumigatus A1163]|uniref:Uncharacterized protein n=1 Tax=Aspergillus fumigatus (strain CBS 144.89 / FGSC A1163 / CEA10) TaxID=451804 RepID=B0Y634_ASPFC|nr:conserved hypothetical protein [Aspergillus fumigatus A1163]